MPGVAIVRARLLSLEEEEEEEEVGVASVDLFMVSVEMMTAPVCIWIPADGLQSRKMSVH